MIRWFAKHKDLSDEQLMVWLASGKTSALEELYDRYHRKVLYFLYRMLGGNQDRAQDMLQEVFLKVIDKAGQFDPDHKFRAWIFTIAANLCKNEFRSQKIRGIIENDENLDKYKWTEKNQEHLLEENIFNNALQTELDKMDAERKTTFLLRFQENYSIKEIAKILDCSPGTIKSRLHYITRELTQKLKDYNPYQTEVSYEG